MNSKQLTHLASCMLEDRRHNTASLSFYGVLAKDQAELFFTKLRSAFVYPASLIINTDEQHLPGKHWVAVTILSASRIEFFDSYALPPAAYGFKFPQYYTSVLNTPHQIQQYTSDRCGHHCLYYVYKRAHGVSVYELCYVQRHDMSTRLSTNDMHVTMFVKHLRQKCAHCSFESCKHLCLCAQSCRSRCIDESSF
jgi:hypothetical protein